MEYILEKIQYKSSNQARSWPTAIHDDISGEEFCRYITQAEVTVD